MILMQGFMRMNVTRHHKTSANYTSKERVKFNKPAPLRQLTRDLNLTSHPKDRVVNSEKNFMNLFVCDCLSHCYDSCTIGCCRGSNRGSSDPKAGVLTTWPPCSPYISIETYLCILLNSTLDSNCSDI